jgi:hypothetical protein
MGTTTAPSSTTSGCGSDEPAAAAKSTAPHEDDRPGGRPDGLRRRPDSVDAGEPRRRSHDGGARAARVRRGHRGAPGSGEHTGPGGRHAGPATRGAGAGGGSGRARPRTAAGCAGTEPARGRTAARRTAARRTAARSSSALGADRSRSVHARPGGSAGRTTRRDTGRTTRRDTGRAARRGAGRTAARALWTLRCGARPAQGRRARCIEITEAEGSTAEGGSTAPGDRPAAGPARADRGRRRRGATRARG